MSGPDHTNVLGGGEVRPAGVGELLSQIAVLLRENLGLYLRLAAVPVGTFAVAYAVMLWVMRAYGLFPQPHAAPDPRQSGVMALAMLCITPPFMVAFVLFEAASCRSALTAIRGDAASFWEQYRYVGRKAGRLLWLMLLRAVVVMLPVMVLGVLAGAGLAVASARGGMRPEAGFFAWPLMALLLLGCVVWAVWLSLYLALAVPVCVDEDAPAWTACRRSGQLARGGKGRIFVVMFLVYLIGMAAIVAFEMAILALIGMGTLAGMLLHIHLSPAARVPGALLLVAVGMVLLYVVIALQWGSYSIALTVLYKDQRLRSEGSAPASLESEPA